MRTLLIPACGTSRLEGVPRMLVRHPSKELLMKRCIQGFHDYSFDQIYFIIRKSDEVKYNIKNLVEKEMADIPNLTLVFLDEDTTCPAQTVYCAIKKLNVTGEIVIHDSDIYVDIPSITSPNFVVGTNIMKTNPTVTNIKDKCFLKINEQNCVLDLIEKRVKSDTICLGVYGIDDADLFIHAYESLSSIATIADHLYISHIMSYLLGTESKIISYYNVDTYENWANDSSWANLKCMLGTYLINFDELIERKDSVNYEIYYKHYARLQQLQDYGAKLVFFTTLSENNHEKITACLNRYNITPHDIVFNCSHNATYIINTKNDLKHQLLNIG